MAASSRTPALNTRSNSSLPVPRKRCSYARTEAQGNSVTRARQDRLLGLLVRDGDWVTASALADGLGVTPRSIRSYVAALNARVPGALRLRLGRHAG